MRKHQYSASVCAKSVFPILPKLDHIIQHFMLFLMMYSKLGHKLTNVKTASINKVLIAFVHTITLRKHLYIHQHRGKTSAHAPNYENMAGNLNINF